MDHDKLIAELVKHRDEAAQLAEDMAQQGDMPNDVAFQNGVWNMAQRIIRLLEEQKIDNRMFKIDKWKDGYWEFGHWETETTYPLELRSEAIQDFQQLKLEHPDETFQLTDMAGNVIE